jgi:surfeit locus 1 family protein
MKPLRITRAGLLGSVLVLVLAATCVRLGFWQLHRLAERRARNAIVATRMSAPALQLARGPSDTTGMAYRRASATGSWDDERSIVLAGRSYNGEPGVYLLTPLRLAAGGGAVLVSRGWLPSPDAATVDLSPYAAGGAGGANGASRAGAHGPTRGATTVTGILLAMPLGAVPPGPAFRRTWYHFDPATLARQFPYPLFPLVLQVLPEPGARGLPRPVAPPALDEGPHFSYAVQWFSFAVIGIVGWIALLMKGRTEEIEERGTGPD